MSYLPPRNFLFSLALLVAACGSPDNSEPPPIAQVSDSHSAALLLVPDESNLSASEIALQDRLSHSGYEVSLATSAASWIEQELHVDLVLVGPDATLSDCGKLSKSNTPMVVMNADCMEALQMVRAPHASADRTETDLHLLSQHPLAAGLGGELRVASDPSPSFSPTLGDDVLRIASRGDNPESVAIFAYGRDASMMEMDAPARRVGWLASSPEHFTLDGWQLFDAAVRWAAQPSVLVLIDGDVPTPSEERMLERLRAPLGFQTEARPIADDHDAIVDRARRARLILLSHSASAETLAEDLQALHVPILTMEPSVLDALEMLAPDEEQGSGTMEQQESLLRQASNHVLGADSSQTLALADSAISVGWGMARDEAIVLASVAGTLERAALFALDRATDPEDSTLPARRFAFLVGPGAMTTLTPEGWQLFDLAVRWSARLFDTRSVCLGRPDGASCADDDACNGVESCQSERCVAAPVDLTDPLLAYCEQEENPEIELRDSPITLLATHACLPDSEPVFQGSEVDNETAVAFQLPKSLPVRLGNAGNATAHLRYQSSAGEIVTCQYRGASPIPHPTSEIDVAKGRQYLFESCSDGTQEGTSRESSWFALDLQGSDCEPAPWRTEVEVHLGLGSCSGPLPAPISAVDSIITRDNFRWSDTKAVTEYDAQGRPSLYHTLIYIESREQRGYLNDLLIHHSLMPIFNSERSRYAGQCGSIEFEGDGQGLFVFAILPGVTYNLLRDYALNPKRVKGDQEVFRVVKLTRPQDPGVSNPDGSLSYEALGAAGFRYMQLEDFPEGGTQSFFISGLIRDVVNAVAETARGAVREVMTGLGKVVVFLGVDSVPFYVDLRVLNRDPLFDPDQTLVSGWNEGREITLPGVRIEVSQYIGGALPVLFYSYTDGDGQLDGLRVAKGRTVQSICIAVQNDAAELTSYVTETMVCGHANSGYAGLGQVVIKTRAGSDPFVPVVASIKPGNITFLTLNSRNRFLHVLALLTDSYEYAKTVVGEIPDSIEVLKGSTANTIGALNGGAAFVPCFGHSTSDLDAAISALAAAIGVVAGPAAGATAAAVLFSVSSTLAVDMILPAEGGVDSFSSRGIVVHEYGHVLFCDLLYKADEGEVYAEMMMSRVESGSDGTPDAHLAYVNEAFADFFFGQVAGAVNYFRPSDNNVMSRDDVYWCHDDSEVGVDHESACLDNNISDRSTFRKQVGRIASTLHDAFDGNRLGYRADRPNDAAMWMDDGNGHLVYTSEFHGHSYDEAVAMNGECLYTVVEKFSQRSDSMRGDLSVLAGLSDAMQEPACSEFSPPTWCDRCVLFANHDDGLSGQASLQDKYEECTSGELAAIIGPAPVNDVTTLAASCSVCPPNYRSPDGVSCVFDPPIDCPPSAPIAVYDGIEQQWTCQAACAQGFVLVNGECFRDKVID